MRKQTTRRNAAWVTALILFLASFTVNAQTVSEQNLALVQSLKPEMVWKNFANLSAIPRCSNNEKAVADMMVNLATKNKMKFFRDTLNNIVVYVSASPGLENRPSVCLQGHIDMVCQARNGSGSDIFPIKFIKEGDTLKASNTTLGADNGFGLSAMMTIMSDQTIVHGPLELFATTGEEIGLVGAKGFDYSNIKSKIIYNIDSEEDALTIGCAGGAVMQTILIPKFVYREEDGSSYSIKIEGFRGGHSGGDINKGRANAIVAMGQLIEDLKVFNTSLISLSGGSAINTIPRECEAVIFIAKKDDRDEVLFQNTFRAFTSKFPSEEIGFTMKLISYGNGRTKVMDGKSQKMVLDMIRTLPNGVLATEQKNKDLVRTSNNIGFVSTNVDTVFIKMLFRSSANSQIDSVKKIIESRSAGYKTELLARFPPWEPDFDGKLIKSASTTYAKIFGKVPLVRTTHGGLEAAIFAERLPGTQIISFGPTIHNAHSPDESIEISSVQKFWTLLLALIGK